VCSRCLLRRSASPALTSTGISARSDTANACAAPRLQSTLRQPPPFVREKSRTSARTDAWFSRALNRISRVAVPRCAGDDVDARDDRGQQTPKPPTPMHSRARHGRSVTLPRTAVPAISALALPRPLCQGEPLGRRRTGTRGCTPDSAAHVEREDTASGPVRGRPWKSRRLHRPHDRQGPRPLTCIGT
jgi:hypothetical protein